MHFGQRRRVKRAPCVNRCQLHEAPASAGASVLLRALLAGEVVDVDAVDVRARKRLVGEAGGSFGR